MPLVALEVVAQGTSEAENAGYDLRSCGDTCVTSEVASEVASEVFHQRSRNF